MLQSANIRLFLIINGFRSKFLDFFFLNITHLGSGYIVIPLTVILYFVEKERIWPVVVAHVLSGVTVQVIKSFFRVQRPAALLERVYVIGKAHHHRSFPSGHTATAMALFYVLSYDQILIVKFAFFLMAFLVGYSRVYIGVHFPLDVFVGALLGITWGYLATQYNFPIFLVTSIAILGMAIRYRSDLFHYFRYFISWIFFYIRNVAR